VPVPSPGGISRHSPGDQVDPRLLSTVACKYTCLNLITVVFSLTCLLARVPGYRVPLSIFISLDFPPLPEKLLPVPAVIQLDILLTLVCERAIGNFGDSSEGASFYLAFLLVSIEGICGGLALYVVVSHFLHFLTPVLSVLIRSVNVF